MAKAQGRLPTYMEDKIVWLVSGPKAYILTFAAGLFAGFALGVHAVRADIGPWALGAIVAAVLVAEARRRRTGPTPSTPFLPAPTPTPTPSHTPSPEIEDAEAALRNLGFGARDARVAVASALASLGDDADVAMIIKAALRSGRT
jgi:hypothetical protein